MIPAAAEVIVAVTAAFIGDIIAVVVLKVEDVVAFVVATGLSPENAATVVTPYISRSVEK